MINWIHFYYKERYKIRKEIEIQLFVKDHVSGPQYKFLRFLQWKIGIYLRLLLYNAYVTFTSSKKLFGLSWVNKMVTKFTCAFSYICGITMKPIMLR